MTKSRHSLVVGVVSIAIGTLVLAGPVRAAAPVGGGQQVALDLLFDQGKRLFDAFEYDQAVPLFDQLVIAITSGATERNDLLVQTYEMRARARFALGDAAGAEQDFSALLAIRPDFRLSTDISPRVVAVFDGVRALMIGQLVVSSTPAGEIQIDDRPYMVPTEPVALDLVAGEHRLVVNRQGFAPQDQPFTVVAGEAIELALVLERVSASLSIVSVPAGAEVVIDGTPRGRTAPGTTSTGPSAPLVIADLPLGQHRIELRRECYAELSLPMNVTQDVVTEPLEMARAVATVRLQSQALDATVYVDGEEQGPLRERQTLTVCEGRRVIEIRGREGRFVDRRDWTRGASETLSAQLRAGFPIVAAQGNTGMPAEQLREAVERALAGAPALLVYAPVQSELEAVLRKYNAPANWLAAPDGGVETSALPREAVRDLGQKITADLGAQGVAAVAVGTEPYEATVVLLAAGSGDPDVITVNTADSASQRRIAERIGAPLPPIVRPSLEVSVVDVAGVSGAVVVRAGASASAAGYAVGDVIVGAGGKPVAAVADLRTIVAALDSAVGLEVEVRGADGGTRSLTSPLSRVIDTMPLRDPAILYNRALIDLTRTAAAASAPTEAAAANLNLAVVHLRLGNWDDALAALGRVQLPDGAGVSAGTVAYLRGLCLEGAGRTSEARTAFGTAAEATEARLSSEGPLVAPLARAKLASVR
jgi:tetratricopeptide (TPR) repeat protein